MKFSGFHALRKKWKSLIIIIQLYLFNDNFMSFSIGNIYIFRVVENLYSKVLAIVISADKVSLSQKKLIITS